MSVEQIVKKLSSEIEGKNRKDSIDSYEELLSENIVELSKTKRFYNLPLKHIFSILSQVDFSRIEESTEIIDIIKSIIKNTIKEHFEEKESILILQYINTSTISCSFEDLFSILESIINCQILVDFCKLYKDQNQIPERDYQYELEHKNQEIEKLKNEIKCIDNSKVTKSVRDDPNIYKIVVLGTDGVGKTSIIIQFVEGRFISEYDPTLEDLYHRPFNVDGETVQLEIIDTAGQDDFAAMRTSYMRNGHGFILIYSINDRYSFEEINSIYKDLVNVKSTSNIPCVICGNKCDLEDRKREISKAEGEKLAAKLKCQFFETSALSNCNIQEMFTKLVRNIIAKR